MHLSRFKITPQQTGKRLDQVVLTHLKQQFKKAKKDEHKYLPTLSKTIIKNLFSEGHIYINEKICRIDSKPAHPKSQIDVFWNFSDHFGFDLKPEHIAFEDEHIIIFNKPTGLSTQPTLYGLDNNLYFSAIEYLRKNNLHKLSYAGLHHRLDRDTSGLVVMTKKRIHNKAVADLFKNRTIKKYYIALSQSEKNPKTQWITENHLARSPRPRHPFFFASTTDKDKGLLAKTMFNLEKSCPPYHLIHAQPVTGRTHQIRVHLSESGFPIIGDRIYNKTRLKKDSLFERRLYLHCHKLDLVHPHTKKPLTIEAPIPDTFYNYKLTMTKD